MTLRLLGPVLILVPPFVVEETAFAFRHLHCFQPKYIDIQGKPEEYIAVSINDNADVIFAGSDAPTALGCMYSIGAIAMESNGKITASVSDLLEEYGVDAARIYINFFDMPRANVGWSKRTFAG